MCNLPFSYLCTEYFVYTYWIVHYSQRMWIDWIHRKLYWCLESSEQLLKHKQVWNAFITIKIFVFIFSLFPKKYCFPTLSLSSTYLFFLMRHGVLFMCLRGWLVVSAWLISCNLREEGIFLTKPSLCFLVVHANKCVHLSISLHGEQD